MAIPDHTQGANMDKLRELIEEFRSVVTGRGNLLDSIVPPLIFLILNALLGKLLHK